MKHGNNPVVLRLRYHKVLCDRIMKGGVSLSEASKIAYDAMKVMKPSEKKKFINKEYLDSLTTQR